MTLQEKIIKLQALIKLWEGLENQKSWIQPWFGSGMQNIIDGAITRIQLEIILTTREKETE